MNKLIFLDIDGVLNSIEDSVYKYENKQHNQSLDNLRNLELLERTFTSHTLNPAKITLLRLVCTEIQAKIILTSTWRKRFSCEEVNEIFQHFDPKWNNLIIDKTPVLDREFRGQEISEYIQKSQFKGDYVILDDSLDYFEGQKDHCIFTNALIGLSLFDLQMVYQKFGIKNYINLPMPDISYIAKTQEILSKLHTVNGTKPKIKLG